MPNTEESPQEEPFVEEKDEPDPELLPPDHGNFYSYLFQNN